MPSMTKRDSGYTAEQTLSNFKLNFTYSFLLRKFVIAWDIAFHDDSTDYIHYYSQNEVDHQKIAEQCDISKISRIDTLNFFFVSI